MKRTIKLTKRQLAEAAGIGYEYLSDGDDRPYSGQSQITADGGMSAYRDIDVEPKTSDDVAANIARPGWYANSRGRNYSGHSICESDADNDNVDDFYGDKQIDALSNGKDNDDIIYVPQSVLQKLETLMDAMKSSRLNAKQCAMVLNKMEEGMDLSSLPYSQRKALRLKINPK